MNNLEEELAKFRKRFSETEDTSGIYKIPTYQIWVHDEPYKIDRVNGKKVKDLYAYGSSQVRLKDIEQFLLDAISRTRKAAYDEFFQAVDERYKDFEITKAMGEILQKLKSNP